MVMTMTVTEQETEQEIADSFVKISSVPTEGSLLAKTANIFLCHFNQYLDFLTFYFKRYFESELVETLRFVILKTETFLFGLELLLSNFFFIFFF